MKKEILKCFKCNLYTFKKNCPECNSKTKTPKPVKYSPQDKYQKYRYLYKKKNVI